MGGQRRRWQDRSPFTSRSRRSCPDGLPRAASCLPAMAAGLASLLRFAPKLRVRTRSPTTPANFPAQRLCRWPMRLVETLRGSRRMRGRQAANLRVVQMMVPRTQESPVFKLNGRPPWSHNNDLSAFPGRLLCIGVQHVLKASVVGVGYSLDPVLRFESPRPL